MLVKFRWLQKQLWLLPPGERHQGMTGCMWEHFVKCQQTSVLWYQGQAEPNKIFSGIAMRQRKLFAYETRIINNQVQLYTKYLKNSFPCIYWGHFHFPSSYYFVINSKLHCIMIREYVYMEPSFLLFIEFSLVGNTGIVGFFSN